MGDFKKEPLPKVHNLPYTSLLSYPTVTHDQAEKQEWINQNTKYRSLLRPVGSASIIFISGGTSMAWHLGFPFAAPTDLLMSWFIGGIVGAVFGAFLCNCMQKKLITRFSALLIIASGILQVLSPDADYFIFASRSLNGIAVGLVFPLVFVLIGEQGSPTRRGSSAAAADILPFSAGILIQTTLYMWRSSIEESFIIGALNIILGVLSFCLARETLVESPLQEKMDVDILRHIQKLESLSTNDNYEQLKERELYLAESGEEHCLKSAFMALPALVKLCLYRSFMALTFAYFVNYAFTYSCLIKAPLNTLSGAFCFYSIARFAGVLIAMLLLDSKGRKPCMTVGFFTCGLISLTVAGIFTDRQNIKSVEFLIAIKFLLIVYQLFASISMSSSSAYLSEAFPLAIKPYYIAIVFIMEMSVHIILLCIRALPNTFNLYYMFNYFSILGMMSLGFVFVAIYLMPETKCNTLRECLKKFRKIIG